MEAQSADREGGPQFLAGRACRNQGRQVLAARVALPDIYNLQHQGLYERARSVHPHVGLQEEHYLGIESKELIEQHSIAVRCTTSTTQSS